MSNFRATYVARCVAVHIAGKDLPKRGDRSQQHVQDMCGQFVTRVKMPTITKDIHVTTNRFGCNFTVSKT